jgi:hypothetical protein
MSITNEVIRQGLIMPYIGSLTIIKKQDKKPGLSKLMSSLLKR